MLIRSARKAAWRLSSPPKPGLFFTPRFLARVSRNGRMRTKLAAEEPEELVIDRNGRLLPALERTIDEIL